MENGRLKDQILGGILGLAVADAVGVPVEFQSRESLRTNPVTDMKGFGTYNQPPGTWSDDTSLTLCLLDSLANKSLYAEDADDEPKPDYADIMQRFLSWLDEGKYTPHGKVFDVGIATRKALQNFRNGKKPLQCGGTSERDNGNGSLMRILPLALYFPVIDRLYHGGGPGGCREMYAFLSHYIHPVSSLTHAHKRSQMACGIYATIVRVLLDKTYQTTMNLHHFECRCGDYEPLRLKTAIRTGLREAKACYKILDYEEDRYLDELKHFERIFKRGFTKLSETEIKSSGYVVDTLEAALWCLLNTNNYRDCVLKAVNLGEDTDTTAAIAGGLAGIYYGVDAIPQEWLSQLARKDYIEKLCEDFYDSLIDTLQKLRIDWKDFDPDDPWNGLFVRQR